MDSKTNDDPAQDPHCFCPSGPVGVFTNGRCECPPLPAGRRANDSPLNELGEKRDTPAEITEALDGQHDLAERGVHCAFEINCPYTQHAVRQKGVCTCVPLGSKEKRDTAESTLPDEQHDQPAVNCAFEVNCPYMQHAIRQDGVCTCVPLGSKEKRDTAESTIPDEQHSQPAAPKVNCVFAINCPYLFHAVRQNGVCTCVPSPSREKRDVSAEIMDSTAERALEERKVNCAFKINCRYMSHAVRQNGMCTCVPSPFKEKRDISEEATEAVEERALVKRKVNCGFKINCGYMQHAVRQNGVCTCIPSPSEEKRHVARVDELDDESEDDT